VQAANCGGAEYHPVVMPSLDPEAQRLILALGLTAHPEGGFYRETFRSQVRLATARGERIALTTIHFLLPAGTSSAFHRVTSDEVWCHAAGDALELHIVSPGGEHTALRLGPDISGGDLVHAVVPAGHWQAARPLGRKYALATCVVAPGFEFEDFVLASRGELEAAFPHLAALLGAFTR
jgi:predicted cupin superfamily sugar epimerase